MPPRHTPAAALAGFALLAALATPLATQGQVPGPAGPVPCADGDLVATDGALLNRQLGAECNHVESVRAWHRAGELFHGYNRTPVDWPAALAEYRRAARLTQGHSPGTLGERRWRTAVTRIAQMLSFGGRGVNRDLAEARRLVASTGVDPAWVARLDQAIAAHAEAARAAPEAAMREGRWRTRLSSDDGSPPEQDDRCVLQEDLDEVLSEGPDDGEPCHWRSLSRSPTHLEASWTCERLVTGRLGATIQREDEHIKATMSADRMHMQRTTTRQYLNDGGPTTTREEGLATRLGDC